MIRKFVRTSLVSCASVALLASCGITEEAAKLVSSNQSHENNSTRVPKNIIMLTCDAFGVLPPISRLTPAQAMYHFLSGFTSKVAGTERGVTEPEPTFSTCFGAPFLPLRPEIYARLLQEKIAKFGVTCWLVNTGWTGGKYGVGNRSYTIC